MILRKEQVHRLVMESSEDTWANDSAAGVQLQLFRERFAQQRDSKRRSVRLVASIIDLTRILLSRFGVA